MNKPIQSPQRLLSASHGDRRVTIGWDALEEMRALSDERLLTCPGCGAQVVLHAGAVRAHHFAHFPGAVCSLPQTEPETEEHRAGKLLLAQWARERVPQAEVTVEAYLEATNQRADLLLEIPLSGSVRRRIAVEFQCANLTTREWQRRHRLYRNEGIEDLWILGGSRCRTERAEEKSGSDDDASLTNRFSRLLRTGELERALIGNSVPLLFLDSVGLVLSEGKLARFRPAPGASRSRPRGRLSAAPLLGLDFPWALLKTLPQNTHHAAFTVQKQREQKFPESGAAPSGERLWQWLEQRFHVTPDTLSPLFGAPALGQETIRCEPRLWQATLYYRFVHHRVGMRWWLTEVETWARAFLPLAQPLPIYKFRRALRSAQDFFAAAGFLSLPVGNSRSNARVMTDLDTLTPSPARDEAIRLAGYRRILDR